MTKKRIKTKRIKTSHRFDRLVHRKLQLMKVYLKRSMGAQLAWLIERAWEEMIVVFPEAAERLKGDRDGRVD